MYPLHTAPQTSASVYNEAKTSFLFFFLVSILFETWLLLFLTFPWAPTAALQSPKLTVCPCLADAYVKADGAHSLSSGGRAPSTDLYQRPGFALHCKPEVAELTVAGVGG